MELPFIEFHLVVITLSILLIDNSDAKKKLINSKEFLSDEIASFGKQHECHLKSLSKSSVYSLWYSNQISSKSQICILKYLESNTKDSNVWCMLGSLYSVKNLDNEANSCFQIASQLMEDEFSKIDKWYYLGPFPIGKSEFDGDPLVINGGIHNASRFRFNSKQSKYFSELSPKGEISWTTLHSSNQDGYFQVRPSIDWNDLVSSLGSMGITEWQGWAVGHFSTTQKEQILSVQCLGVARCLINNISIAGDFYRRNDYWTSIKISRGVHQIFLPLRAKVLAQFKFSIAKQNNFIVMAPSFLPQIYDGYLPKETYITIPVSNQMGKKWLGISRVSVQDSMDKFTWKSTLHDKEYRIAPGQIMHVIIKLSSSVMEKGDRLSSSCSDITLKLNIKTSEGSSQLDVTLKCRKRGSSFLFTFIDHDGSVQHAAAIEPLGSCPDLICPIVLTLHGTTVPPQNQADSYKQMVQGDFQFGVANMWLLAPTRHGAHNWEGPGALTAIFAVQALTAMVHSCSWLKMKVDPSKILFAGHSMGGHGALHLASHFPDRAIGLMSLAGWIKKEDYGDSNLFFRHDVATSHVDPMTKSMMESCVAENDVDKHVSNLKGIPVLLRIGAQDRTVHPFFLRRMFRLMKEAQVNVKYSELPKLEHWWWDTKETNDGGCMNDADIRKFMSDIVNLLSSKEQSYCSKNKNKGCGKAGSENLYSEALHEGYRTITFVTFNPAFGESMKGVKILQQIAPLQKSVIEMSFDKGKLILATKNVKCAELTDNVPDAAILWTVAGEDDLLTLEIDGSDVTTKLKDAPLILCRHGSVWERVEFLPDMSRNPGNYGPARRVAERQFIIIVGTQGNEFVSGQILMHATYLANQFMLTSDCHVPIVKDTDIQDYAIDDKNLIIIGSEEENRLTAEYLARLADLKIDANLVSICDSCHYKWSQSGILTLAPHGPNGLALLLMGGSMTALEDVIHLATPTIPPMARSPFSNLLPDYVITGPQTGLRGPGGFECTGFWDNSWRYSLATSSCVCR